MNRENKRILHDRAPDRASSARDPLPGRAWKWIFVGQLSMLAGFVGLSLIALAVTSLFSDDGGRRPGELLALGLTGALLVGMAWRGIARILEHAERELSPESGLDARQRTWSSVSTSPKPAHTRITGITPTL